MGKGSADKRLSHDRLPVNKSSIHFTIKISKLSL